MLFSSFTSSPTTLQCHFCLNKTSFEAGSVPKRPTEGGARSRQLQQQQHGRAGFKWFCSRCDCWNGWDSTGETLTDHYAMHDPAENRPSFSKRATTPSTSFLTPPSKSPFCTSCTTNHSLVINLLANYLPDENDPSYPELLARLPEYKTSVFERYPPLCSNCEPTAEELIRKGDYRAKTSALNGFLNHSSSIHPSFVSTSSSVEDPSVVARSRTSPAQTAVWHLRGLLWTGSILYNIVLLAAALYFSRPPVPSSISLIPSGFFIGLAVVSILWLGWDPLSRVAINRPPGWLRRQRTARKQQMILLYPIRLITSFLVTISQEGWIPNEWWTSSLYLRTFLGIQLAIESLVLLVFLFTSLLPPPKVLRPIRLTRSNGSSSQPLSSHPSDSNLNSHSSSSFPLPTPTPTPPPFASSSQPPSSLDIFGRPHHPLFGAPPTWPNPPHNQVQTTAETERDDAAMDWTPLPSSSAAPSLRQRPAELNDEEEGGEDETWKLFNRAPTVFGRASDGKSGGHEATGLERLLEGWGLGEGSFGAGVPSGSMSTEGKSKGWMEGWFGGGGGGGGKKAKETRR
ncbi:Ima1 N-terminal domain-containing protein [Mrakia frigida]|uniref:Ima1 N-terminal domain-containing protein n=1 Tax=Mrakia frigida TaxID=29902 RepID=UPI003FCC105C